MRIAYIDVLKAFAIIAVVLYHAGMMTYGYLGVDLFLVIAGYLTTRSLYAKAFAPKEHPSGGGYFIFEISRVIRLLPPLLVAGTICMFLGYFIMLPDDYENLGQSVIATNTFGNNILAAITTKDYWAISNEYKPLMHTWYVGVLMQFYLLYPVLFLLTRYDKNNPKGKLLTMISTLSIISLLLYFATTDTAHRFYFLPSRFYEFAVGGIAAIIYNPQKDKPYGRGFVYACYAFLLILMFVNVDVISPVIRLVAVVFLSCVLLCSQDILENKITGNAILARIGAASYSIFIWHQIILAFYRYTVTSRFGIGSYIILLISTSLLSWFSYHFVEQKTTQALKTKRGKILLYLTTVIVFVILNVFAGWVYLRAGVVRDVPELYISKNEVHRGMHAEYCDRGNRFDKPFVSDKLHWLVIGNSFGRDFVNVILESPISDKVEVSYINIEVFHNREYNERFKAANRVFVSSLGVEENTITEIEVKCLANGFNPDRMVIVGEKNFGDSNGIFYSHRNSSDYFIQRTIIRKEYLDKNKYYKNIYKNRYLDLISLVIDNNSTVPVFTPDNHYISQDCKHFSRGGAIYYGQLIDWSNYLK